MNVIAIDCEMAQPSNKIIQIGACAADLDTGTVLDTFMVFVNPEEKLSEYIKDLTRITQEQVDKGVSLYDAYLMLKEFHEKHKCFMNPIEWNGGDSQLIKVQLEKENHKVFEFQRWCFGRRFLDAKTLYQSYRMANGRPPAGGLARAMTKFNIAFKGAKHDAKDDAVNTFRVYFELIKLFRKVQ